MRYLMDDHSFLLGMSNGDNIYFGKSHGYWAERQAFMLGTKFDVSIGWINETPYDLNSPMNTILRQAIISRDAFQWWDKEPTFRATAGVSHVSPAVSRVARFEGNDGITYLAFDNYRALATQISVTVDQTARSYSIPLDRLTGDPKYVVICPLNPEDGPCQ
jgi:hypothetical protein